MGPLTAAYLGKIREVWAALPPVPSQQQLNTLLRWLARWRSDMLANSLIAMYGLTIQAGPFKGLTFVQRPSEGAAAPRILGTYEQELQPYLERFGREGFECLIDVGCAEGYYAVGLARLWDIPVYAYDIDPNARKLCAQLAELNGVADKVTIRPEFRPETFEEFRGRKAFVIMDVEGAEIELLRPDLAPALAEMSLIVETHDNPVPDTTGVIAKRFEATHDVVRVDIGLRSGQLPEWLVAQPHLDQLLAVWEWRGIPTPWLVMTPKTR